MTPKKISQLREGSLIFDNRGSPGRDVSLRKEALKFTYLPSIRRAGLPSDLGTFLTPLLVDDGSAIYKDAQVCGRDTCIISWQRDMRAQVCNRVRPAGHLHHLTSNFFLDLGRREEPLAAAVSECGADTFRPRMVPDKFQEMHIDTAR